MVSIDSITFSFVHGPPVIKDTLVLLLFCFKELLKMHRLAPSIQVWTFLPLNIHRIPVVLVGYHVTDLSC